MSSLALQFGIPRGAYPEKSQPRLNALDRLADRVADPLTRWLRSCRFDGNRFLQNVAQHNQTVANLNDRSFREAAQGLRLQLRREGFRDDLVAQSFALVREAAQRTLGERHFDVQLVGGRVLLDGMVAEMETGEGKTLTATLPACTAAFAGVPVHIITVNDYLANRDARWMGPIYETLGVTVGIIVQGMDPDARRAAYSADVTYCTNKEVAFDYLKDQIVLKGEAHRAQLQVERLYQRQPRLGRLLLRGLCYGIVDEADSVLIDEARTPLIISGANPDTSEKELYQTALALGAEMTLDRDFAIEGRERTIRLLPAGLERLATRASSLGGVWIRRQWREELLRQALSAQHLFLKDKQYLVKENRIQIIDEYTGRVMPDRSWEHGLHQLIEVKEGCPPTRRVDPLARISYQRFFRRYLRLAGMTGTAREVSRELWSVYRLATVCISTNLPLRRQRCPDRVYLTAGEKWRAVVERIAEFHDLRRPVLVGTRSVAASEHLSRLLAARGFTHRVLNARQDREEAEIIAQAGGEGQITVATNMAGRGTDIRLSRAVAARGGLHVIATERHEARRIDRQLFGRCARQGDPGTFEAIVSLEDELVRIYAHGLWKKLCALVARPGHAFASWVPAMTVRLAQRAAERLHLRMRRDLLKMDEQMQSALAFSGRPE